MIKRRITQVSAFILLNLPLIGPWKWLCVPVLNCHSCPWAVFACPIGVFGHFAEWMVIPWLALGVFALLGTLFGRLLCGWICPFGFLQDLLHKIPSPKFEVPRWMFRVKYVLLIGTVLLVPMLFGIENRAFYCWLCPVGTLESMLPRTLMEGNYGAFAGSWLRILVLFLVLLWAISSSRSFCKVLCPIGALLAVFNRISAFSLQYHQKDCPVCEQCIQTCPMDVRMEDIQGGDAPIVVTAPSECILCLTCTGNCERSGLRFSIWNLLPRRGNSAE